LFHKFLRETYNFSQCITMRSFPGKRENSSNDELVDVVTTGKNVGNVHMINEKVGSKVKKFESIFRSS